MSGAAPREGLRRAIHLASAVFGLAAIAGTPHRTMTITLLCLVVAALALEAARHAVPAVQRAFEVVALGAMRPSEARGLTGATLLSVGYAATWLLFPAAAAAPALVVAATCDPAAATVGRLAVPAGGRKTWAGTAGAFGAATLVLLLLGTGWRLALAAGAVAALVERLPGRGLDNLAIPLATAAALRVLA